jgi:hypothetical protein
LGGGRLEAYKRSANCLFLVLEAKYAFGGGQVGSEPRSEGVGDENEREREEGSETAVGVSDDE